MADLDSIVERDVPDVAALSKPGQVPALLQVAAQFTSRLTNLSELGRAVALDHKTTESYLRVLEHKNEVDFVLENAQGKIVGIEVKSAASVVRSDFRDLERLAAVAGRAFVQGIILYDVERALSFADHLRAAPVAALWA